MAFLHALPFDGRMWQGERDALAGGGAAGAAGPAVPVVVPSLYRLGDSLEEWAHGVLGLVGDDPLVVVGCSVGGSCALEVARAAPELVRGLVLVGAKAGVRPDPAARDEAVDVLVRRGLRAVWDTYWRPLFGPRTPDDVVEQAREMVLDQDVQDVVRGVRAFHDRRDRTDFALTWPRPIVVIHGADDRTPSPSTAAAITTVPNRRFHLVDGSGHYVNLEQPATFRQLLTEAVEAISATGPTIHQDGT